MNQEWIKHFERRAKVEQSRMIKEGFKIRRGRWREIFIPEDKCTRCQLRLQLARGSKYILPDGKEIEGTLAVHMLEGRKEDK